MKRACFRKRAAGQDCWQILPLGPTSYGDSPYQSFSTFAGNPYFISLEDLIEEGVLSEKECDAADFGTDPSSVDYAKIYKSRTALLRKAYERSNIAENEEFLQFQQEEAWWLKDYALFMAVKQRFDGKPWSEWAEDIRLRWQNALDYYREELYFISLEDLIEEGVLSEKECDSADFGQDPSSVDYAKIYKSRTALLRKAYDRINIAEN